MLMADTLAIFFVILGLMLALPALWLFCRSLWPGMVAGVADSCDAGLVKSFWVGLPISASVVFLAGAIGKHMGGVGNVCAVALVCLYFVYAHTGVSGLVTLIGRRLPSPSDAERPWRTTVRGGIVLELSCLLPILGWFVILPMAMIIGCGAVTRAFLKPRKSAGVSADLGERAAAVQSANCLGQGEETQARVSG